MLPSLTTSIITRCASKRLFPLPISNIRKMSVKTLPVLDHADLQDGQMKEVDFDKGKVLLCRFGDNVYATSAFCTHYGAALAKGVLIAEGGVICPWHGACFNLCTGDIEDAPALNALHSFKTHVADGKIFVTADPAQTLRENKSREPTLSLLGSEGNGRGVVIVGGGSGAFQAVESLREVGYKGAITVLSKEAHMPIDRTMLSKSLTTDITKLELRTASELKIKYNTTVRIGVTVTGVDVERKKVFLEGGKETFSYDHLILATGGTPRRLPVEGATLENVYTFRGIEDAKKVDAAAQEGKRLVIIGSSFISMEIANAMASRKLASIDVIGMEEYPFEAVLGKEVGKGILNNYESKGLKFHMKSKVEKIVPAEGNSALAGGVVVNGQTIPADFVIMGVGVAPATDFLKGSAIELENDGGIKVDEFLRVEGTKDVFAIGDIAHYLDIYTCQYVRIEHWNVAGNHGRAVGRTIAGDPQPFAKIPIFWSTQGLRYCGRGVGFDEVIVKGDPMEMKFIAYYAKKGKVIAVASMQNDPVVSKASELFRLRTMPSAEEIKSGLDLLSIDVSTVASRAIQVPRDEE